MPRPQRQILPKKKKLFLTENSLCTEYYFLQAEKKNIVEILAMGISMIASAYLVEFLFQWYRPDIHHIVRDALNLEELGKLTPRARHIWKISTELKQLADKVKNFKPDLEHKTVIHVSRRELGAGFQLLEFIADIPEEKLNSTLKKIIAKNRDVEAAIIITKRLFANGLDIEKIFQYFYDRSHDIHPMAIVNFFSKNIQELYEPLLSQIRADIQWNILDRVIKRREFLIGNMIAPFILNTFLLYPIKKVVTYFEPKDIPHDDAELDSALTAPEETQLRMREKILSHKNHLAKLNSSSKRLAFWIGVLSFAASSAYFLFRAPHYVLIMVGSSIVTLPIINKVPIITNYLLRKGGGIIRYTWNLLRRYQPEKELEKLRIVLGSPLLSYSRIILEEDETETRYFKIKIHLSNRKGYHAAQALSLLLLENGVTVDKIEGSSVLLSETKIKKLKNLETELSERLEKIEQSEGMILILKKHSSLTLQLLTRNYESGPYAIILQTENEAHATIMRKEFPLMVPDQPSNLFNIHLTEENIIKLKKCLSSFSLMSVAKTVQSSSGFIETTLLSETPSVELTRKPKRRHLSCLEEVEESNANSSSCLPASRANSEKGGCYFFKTAFDRRSQEQYSEICERVREKIEAGEMSLGRAKNASCVKLYGGKQGIFVPKAGIFQAAYKIPSTKLRVWANLTSIENGIEITFKTIARSVNLKKV